jgi:hypothetical protein
MPIAAMVAGTVGSSVIGAVGATSAASTQANAAMSAQQLQAQEAQNALNFQEQEFNTTQQNEAPFIQAGQGAVTSLASLVNQGNAGSGPLAPWNQTFTPPTGVNEINDPGYQFRLNTGLNTLTNSAAARGGLLSTGTAKNLEDYAQNSASSEYSNVYNRSLNDYLTNFNVYNTNSTNTYNRLASLAGLGQTATGTAGQLGQQAANTTANIDLTTGQQQGNDLMAAGAANASGYVGAANAISSGISSLGGNVSQYLTLQQLLAQMNGGTNQTFGPYGSYNASQGYGVPTPPGYGASSTAGDE